MPACSSTYLPIPSFLPCLFTLIFLPFMPACLRSFLHPSLSTCRSTCLPAYSLPVYFILSLPSYPLYFFPSSFHPSFLYFLHPFFVSSLPPLTIYLSIERQERRMLIIQLIILHVFNRLCYRLCFDTFIIRQVSHGTPTVFQSE